MSYPTFIYLACIFLVISWSVYLFYFVLYYTEDLFHSLSWWLGILGIEPRVSCVPNILPLC